MTIRIKNLKRSSETGGHEGNALKAFKKGRIARYKGMKLADNPFYYVYLTQAWEDGWHFESQLSKESGVEKP